MELGELSEPLAMVAIALHDHPHELDLRNIKILTRLFKISGKWSVQASKQALIHTRVRNEVTLVWGSLRLAPTKYAIQQHVLAVFKVQEPQATNELREFI